LGIDETTPSANRGSLVQVDAHRANVALTRPVRMPDVRTEVSGVLGRAFAGHTACERTAVRNPGPRRLGSGN